MNIVALQILFHHHVSGAQYKPNTALSKSESAAYVELKQLDLLTERGEVTLRGVMYIETLLDAPLPEWVKPTWTRPKGKKS